MTYQCQRLPLRITTTRALVNPLDGLWHPGHPLRCAPDATISAVWRDEAGRARSLIPWHLDEPQLQEPATLRRLPPAGSLSDTCAAWDAAHPLEHWVPDDLRVAGSGPRGG